MKAKALLSAITGFFFGLITYFLLQYLEMDNALLISFFTGLLFYILLFVFLLVYGKIMDKKYVFCPTKGSPYTGEPLWAQPADQIRKAYCTRIHYI